MTLNTDHFAADSIVWNDNLLILRTNARVQTSDQLNQGKLAYKADDNIWCSKVGCWKFKLRTVLLLFVWFYVLCLCFSLSIFSVFLSQYFAFVFTFVHKGRPCTAATLSALSQLKGRIWLIWCWWGRRWWYWWCWCWQWWCRWWWFPFPWIIISPTEREVMFVSPMTMRALRSWWGWSSPPRKTSGR